MTVSDASLDESGSNFAIVAATSLLLGVTRTSSEAYLTTNSMNATDYLNFKLPKGTTSKALEGEQKLIPHLDNGSPRLPSTTKHINRFPGSDSSL